jgi:NodT family efflux transporter outer membrane factor (OMF) lipoprotein
MADPGMTIGWKNHLRIDMQSSSFSGRTATANRSKRAIRFASLCAGASLLASCMVGPDYQKPDVQIPTAFKEGVEWQRAQANPQAAISSTWWQMYGDNTLNGLVDQALKANQSIAVAEAAYRAALATVAVDRAGLFPTVKAGLVGSRSGGATTALGTLPGNAVEADVSASWELDLWGQIRRQIEQAKAQAQASDAQLAGERISITASVVTDYFELRQADYDLGMLAEQEDIDAKILAMTQAGLSVGASSNDDVLNAQGNLELVVAVLQSTATSREQYEHALAVLAGQPPENFQVAPDPNFKFTIPPVPTGLPSELLQRRYDVVSAERTAAAANANIGVTEAAFYPSLTLTAEGGFANTSLSHLFSVPHRFWTLGPDLAETIFDGGERTASVNVARANYDEQVATYRNTVLSALQSVEDSLSAMNHLRMQADAYNKVLDSNQHLFASQQAQFNVGASSQQNLLNQRLTLIQAEENLRDTQALLAESNVTLVKNLGGGWQQNDGQANAQNPSSSATAPATPSPVSQAALPGALARPGS